MLLPVAPLLSRSPPPAPNSCSLSLCVGFPLDLEGDPRALPQFEINSANGSTAIAARYSSGREIFVTSKLREESDCVEASGGWQKVALSTFTTKIVPSVPEGFARQCWDIKIDFVGFSEAALGYTNVDLWLMRDYFLGSNGEFVAQPFFEMTRFFPRDVE